MKSLRLVLLSILICAAALTAWLLPARNASPASNCAPGDLECVREALDRSVGKSMPERSKILADASRITPTPEDICGAYGYMVGAQSSDPSVDLDTLLQPDSTIGCRDAVTRGVLDAWIATSPTKNDLARVLGRCSRSDDPLCAEIVAVAAAAIVSPSEAAGTCYRLAPTSLRNCLTSFLYNVYDKSVSTDSGEDPREDVVVFCVYWPLERPVEDCYSAAGPVFYVSAFGGLRPDGSGFAAESFLQAAGFCARFGEGSLSCESTSYPLGVFSGRVGKPDSPLRTNYCSTFDRRLRDDCLSLDSADPGATLPG